MSPRKYDTRSRLAAAEETRRRIVEATVELHASHGPLATTHEMIAQHAGVSLPTVYKYFPTRNELIPHCSGLVLGNTPVHLDESMFQDEDDAPARLRTLARRQFQFHQYMAPWLRWSVGAAAELPAVRELLDAAEQARIALIRAALAPAFGRRPPRRLLALANVLLDFPSWLALTGDGFTSSGAAAVVSDALLSLQSTMHKEES